MRLRLIAVLVCGLATLSCSTPEPPKDLLIKRKVVAAAGPLDSSVYWGSRYRITDDATRRISFDREAKTVTVLDKKSNAYFTITFDQVLEQRKKQDDRFEALPAEERAKVGLDKPIELTATGKSETISGHVAKEYSFNTPQMKGAVWLAESIAPPVSWAEWNDVIANIESSGYAGRRLSEAIARINGYPVRSSLDVTLGTQRATMTLEVTEVAFGKIPDEIVQLPTGAIKAEAPIK